MAQSPSLRAAGSTNNGPVRRTNQADLLIAPTFGLFAVADQRLQPIAAVKDR